MSHDLFFPHQLYEQIQIGLYYSPQGVQKNFWWHSIGCVTVMTDWGEQRDSAFKINRGLSFLSSSWAKIRPLFVHILINSHFPKSSKSKVSEKKFSLTKSSYTKSFFLKQMRGFSHWANHLNSGGEGSNIYLAKSGVTFVNFCSLLNSWLSSCPMCPAPVSLLNAQSWNWYWSSHLTPGEKSNTFPRLLE